MGLEVEPMKEKNMVKNVARLLSGFLLGLALAFGITACGGSDTGEQPIGEGTPTPTPTPTPDPCANGACDEPDDLPMHHFAKATIDSNQPNKENSQGYEFKEQFVRDGYKKTEGASVQPTKLVWLAEDGNSASVKLEFNGTIKLSEVRLWDIVDNHNVTAGRLRFTAPGSSPGDVFFAALPSGGTTPLVISDVDGLEVDSVEVVISSFDKASNSDDSAGFSEVEIYGTRLTTEDEENTNLALFSYLEPLGTTIKKTDRVNGPGSLAEDHSLYGLYNMVEDGHNGVPSCVDLDNGSHSFLSEGAGANMTFRMSFDRAYDLDAVVVYDLKAHSSDGIPTADKTEITAFTLRFSDGTDVSSIGTVIQNYCVLIDLAGQDITTTSIQFEVDNYVPGDGDFEDDTGLAAIRVFGTPAD